MKRSKLTILFLAVVVSLVLASQTMAQLCAASATGVTCDNAGALCTTRDGKPGTCFQYKNNHGVDDGCGCRANRVTPLVPPKVLVPMRLEELNLQDAYRAQQSLDQMQNTLDERIIQLEEQD